MKANSTRICFEQRFDKYYTDEQLGAQHGRLGNAAKYPNNANYMRGFVAGSAHLARQLALDEPFEDMRPGGTNDQSDI